MSGKTCCIGCLYVQVDLHERTQVTGNVMGIKADGSQVWGRMTRRNGRPTHVEDVTNGKQMFNVCRFQVVFAQLQTPIGVHPAAIVRFVCVGVICVNILCSQKGQKVLVAM